jgi:hypothetical protein
MDTYHDLYAHCNYVKCGYHLGLKGKIGYNHWGCCYTLDREAEECTSSKPHTLLYPILALAPGVESTCREKVDSRAEHGEDMWSVFGRV